MVVPFVDCGHCESRRRRLPLACGSHAAATDGRSGVLCTAKPLASLAVKRSKEADAIGHPRDHAHWRWTAHGPDEPSVFLTGERMTGYRQALSLNPFKKPGAA
jgi:hypothetical protein